MFGLPPPFVHLVVATVVPHCVGPRSQDPIRFSPYLYRARNLVERFFNRIKQCRRVATRYDKLAANYLAFIKLASIRIWLRAYGPRPKLSWRGDVRLGSIATGAGQQRVRPCPLCPESGR
jgi:hypothetical protein